MASGRATAFLLLFLFLSSAYAEETPEPIFRSEGSVIELGYCFGADYILVYRSGSEGDQLLGNSSSDRTLSSLPADLLGRVGITTHQHLLGLQIAHLRHSDQGVYRRECWQNRTLANQHSHHLYVCSEEVDSEGIVLMEDGGAELLCNSTWVGQEGATVRWYYEVLPSYKTTLFLDTGVSLEPLVEELRGVVKVRDGGVSLHAPDSVLKSSQQFYCQVMEGQNCLSFQNIYLPDRDDTLNIFASEGERVALDCPSDHKRQRWETPLGIINSTTKTLTTAGGNVSDQIYISDDDQSGNYSLVIPEVSDQLSGEYSCFSPSLVASYTLVVCPRQDKPRQKVFLEGGDVLLECEVSTEGSPSLQWHRRLASEGDSLILDSNDKSVPIPEDLRGRVVLPEHGYSSLRLTDLTVKDAGVYWCVVLGGPEYLEDDDDYLGGDGDDDDYDEDDYSDSEHWVETYRCISKQVTALSVTVTQSEGIGRGFGPAPSDLTSPDGRMGSGLENGPTTSEPSAASNTIAYALGGALAGLAVVGAVATVIAVKKKKQKAANGSGLKADKDTEMREDPGCTERLNPKQEYDA